MPENHTIYQERLNALREKLTAMDLNGFIIPHTDEYQSEVMAAYAMRIPYITGFTGSAAIAAVLDSKAVILTDGRYTIQVEKQVCPELFEIGNSTKINIGQWLATNALSKATIGYDPWLHSSQQIEVIKRYTSDKIILKPVLENPIDAIWPERMGRPMNPVELFPDEIAGATSTEKRNIIAQELRDANVDACLITLADSVCWLLNVRGRDVNYTPLVLSYALLHSDGSLDWFIDLRKIPENVHKHLGQTVRIVSPFELENTFELLQKKKIWIDRTVAAVWFETKLMSLGVEIIDRKDPCILPKSIKFSSEIESMRQVHVRDGVSMVRLLNWLDEEAKKGRQTELDVDERIQEFRSQNYGYQGPSFPTIAGYGANGAIIHYRATEGSYSKIEPSGLLVVDSGGQYMWGTTDVTRTVAIGIPTQEMCRNYTLVLKGHIALAMARFPEGTKGVQLDALARQHLWNAGLDYQHGTGHGVGCYLSVHEEAASISPRGQEPLKAGMILSNEPGYYKQDHYGIRIENLVLVTKCSDESGMLCFDTLTLVPFEQKLIVKEMLEYQEILWLLDYYRKINEILTPVLRPELQKWLRKQTPDFLQI